MDPDRYRLDELAHQTIFEQDIQPDIFSGAKSSARPVAVIFGGQPGAGKSTSVAQAMLQLQARGGAVLVSGDDFRAYHPHYARLMGADDKTAAFYTDRDAGSWVEKAIAEARARRVNMVIEGTMRDAGKVAGTMQSLRAAGYEIDARVLAVNERLSQQGIIQRYENQKCDRGVGRMTTPQAHQAAFAGLPVTLERIEREKLADRVTLYQRGDIRIYQNELSAGEWVSAPRARESLEAERSRPMNLEERRSYAEGFDRLAELIARPGRQANPDELGQVEELRQQARQELAAEVFRQEAPPKAIQRHPELAPAYAFIRAVGAGLEGQGIDARSGETVMARVRENVARNIEQGKMPSEQIQEASSIAAGQHKPGPER